MTRILLFIVSRMLIITINNALFHQALNFEDHLYLIIHFNPKNSLQYLFYYLLMFTFIIRLFWRKIQEWRNIAKFYALKDYVLVKSIDGFANSLPFLQDKRKFYVAECADAFYYYSNWIFHIENYTTSIT